jgi:anti-sigma regulatory factor (Ser/Thr protein kinase)
VEIWDGEDVELAICLEPKRTPPEKLCISENLEETLKFFKSLKKILTKGHQKAKPPSSFWVDRPRNGPPIITRFFDFSEISRLGTAPAVVMTALYDTARITSGSIPPAVNFSDWSPQSFQTLYEIGFFDLIGHAPASQVVEVYEEKYNSAYRVSKVLSGENADGLEQASNIVADLLEFLSVDIRISEVLIPEINSAVSEAMINVARHAYPNKASYQNGEYPIRKWWMSARADQRSNTLAIVVYDRGATIPGTLPHKEWYKQLVQSIMSSFLGDFDYANHRHLFDHEYINYSMKEGKTQTSDARRGLGLPQMQRLIDECRDGTLSILSRNGLYKYGKSLGVHKQMLKTGIEGTLIEWQLTLPKEYR